MSMDTEKARELLAHFKAHGVSHEPKKGLDEVLAYQDVMGHSYEGDIEEFWATLDAAERRHFLFVNFTTLDQEQALHIVRLTALEDMADRWRTDWQQCTKDQRAEIQAERDEIEAERQLIARWRYTLEQRIAEQGKRASLALYELEACEKGERIAKDLKACHEVGQVKRGHKPSEAHKQLMRSTWHKHMLGLSALCRAYAPNGRTPCH